MIVDENLNDCSLSIIQSLKCRIKDLHRVNSALCTIAIIFSIAFFVTLGLYLNKKDKAEILTDKIQQEEQILSLEYSIGYWFINNPKEINDTALYQFLLDNNAWYPDILLKQAKIESANYTSNVYKNTNNLYGIRKVGKRQTTQLNNIYNGYGCYNNWCLSVLDRMLWDVFVFKGEKPSEEEYLKAMGIYAEDKNYINKLK